MQQLLNKYEWDRIFRERIIALCFNSTWYSKYGNSIIKPEYFELEAEQKLVEFVLNYYQAYSHPPDDDEVLAEFCGDQDVATLMDAVSSRFSDDLEYAEVRAVQFAKEQAIKLAFLDSMGDLERGRFSQIISRMEKALSVGQNLDDSSINLMDISQWAYFDELDTISTGMPLLDKRLGGGLGRGEIGFILAPTNVGKTFVLVNLGFGAAGVISKSNVLHASFEDSAKNVARRYAARIADYHITKDSSVVEYSDDFYWLSAVRIFGKIKIKHWPTNSCSSNDLKMYIDQLIMQGFNPDMLIVDYPEIMRHESVGEYRHNISHTVGNLRGMADPENYNLAIWAGAQTNRGGLNQELVSLDTIAEDYGIAKLADIVLSISQTKEEYAEGLWRLFGNKVRTNEKNWILRCAQIREAHAIIALEEMSHEQMWEERKQRKQEADKAEEVSDKLKSYKEQRGKK